MTTTIIIIIISSRSSSSCCCSSSSIAISIIAIIIVAIIIAIIIATINDCWLVPRGRRGAAARLRAARGSSPRWIAHARIPTVRVPARCTLARGGAICARARFSHPLSRCRTLCSMRCFMCLKWCGLCSIMCFSSPLAAYNR